MNSNFAPWQAKGRWYRVIAEWNQTDKTFTIIKSDLPVSAYSGSSVTIGLPKDFVGLQTIVNNNSLVNYKSVRGDLQYGYSSSHERMQVYLGGSSDFGYSGTIEAWIFGYFDEATAQAESEG